MAKNPIIFAFSKYLLKKSQNFPKISKIFNNFCKVPKLPRLSHSFAKELKPLSDASPGTFAPYGQLITDFAFHNEQPQWTAWPGTLPEEATGGTVLLLGRVRYKTQGNRLNGVRYYRIIVEAE